MATSDIRSITSSVIKFIKGKLSFLASKFRLLFSKPQAATHVADHALNESQDLQDERSIEGMTTSSLSNEVSIQVQYKNEIYRSRFDMFTNLCQHNVRRRRSRAVSRIPTRQIKRVMQKSKKVVIIVRKHVRKVVPQSSKLHTYLNIKSSAYHRLNIEFCGISDRKHKSARKQRSNHNKKHYQSRNHCFTKQQRMFFVNVQTRTSKHKKCIGCVHTDERGLKKLQCHCVKILWVADRTISLSGDVEKNPGPSTQMNIDKNDSCAISVNSVSLLESRLAELGRIPVNVLGDGNCFFRAVSCQLYNTPDYHVYIRCLGIQHLLHHPELYIESNFEQSWQNYVNNMARQGTWADNIIIQAVANSLNVTINIIESNENFSPITVVHPVNTNRDTTNIYIGHIQEYHYVSSMQTLNSNTSEMRSENRLIQKSVSSHEDQVEQYQETQFPQNKHGELVIREEDDGKRANESEANKAEKRKASKREYMRKKRANPDYRQSQNRLSETDKAEKRRASNREYMRKKRQNPDYMYRQRDKRPRTVGLECDSNMELREKNENCKTKTEKRKAAKIEHMQKKRKKLQQMKIQKETNNMSTITSEPCENYANACKSMISNFHDNISCGPEYICTCCDQLWYKSSVRKCNASNYSKCQQKIVQSCITGVKSANNTEWICNTCHLNINQGKLPTCSKANGMGFPDKPATLDLTPLEERLVSPRIPFMQIRELPRGGQLSIHGNVVNVPSDVNSTVHALPRLISESQTIPIKLKRRLSYKHHYQFQNVRPKKVLEAAKYLVSTSELFKSEGIHIQDTWQNSATTQAEENEEWHEFINNNVEKDSEKDIQDTANNYNDNLGCINSETIDNDNDDDNWCEVDERPSGVTDTLLQEPEIAENVDNIISFAPGEGNKPLGIFMDKDSEFLSFPTIFCGKRRADNNKRKVPVSYSTVAKWELRCQDRRAARSVPNLFYKLKKLQIKQIQDTACISLRKCKTKGKKYTAGELKSEDRVNKLIHLDEGFRVLKNLRGSPAYFQKCKRDLFAVIRQLGKPTWFCSFSAAETRWTHLLKTLGRIVEKKDYSDDEINNMTWQQKSNLIQSDPVTCARNFDHMVQLFIHDVLKSDVMPIGQIADYFYRVEFQQRGSPHVHGLFWVKDAPQYGKSSDEKVVSFIDKYVTCQKAHTSEMEDLVNLQLHRHAKTCKKMGHKICRFNFPLPPMRQTIVLTPLEDYDTFDNERQKNIKKHAEEIKDQLDRMKYGEDITFDEFLDKLGLTEETYIVAVRYTINHNTLFLKRLPSEIRINNYNTQLLKAWRANMDMQYVLDPYACATYILSYITKGQTGMSRLLEKATEEINSGNKDIAHKVRHIGNKFLNAVEISAQEAAFLVLQMPLRRSTRDFQFINTSHPDERTFLLKKLDKIKELPDNSSDIESDNIIKRYQRRPKQLENLCLADFVAWFNCIRANESDVPTVDKSDLGPDNFIPETLFEANTNDDDPYNVDGNIYEEQNEPQELKIKGGMKLVKRTKPKIIRSVRFHKSKDPENHYREQLMLYAPWRKENTDLLGHCETYQERFNQVKEQLLCNRLNYEYHSDLLDKAMEHFDNDHFDDSVAPNAQHINDQDSAKKQKPSELFGCFDPGSNKQHSQYDLLDDIGIFPRCDDQEDLLVKRISNEEYHQLVRSLNEKQRQFFYHVLHSVKTSDDPLRLFLSGGAGVGKSTVTNALYEALIRYLNKMAGENPDEINVIKAAPTGKAAFNIKGNTLHAAFKIPANKGFEYCVLDSDRLNTIRAKLRKLKILFIDEISMVGTGMFNFLNLRLQQIMGTKEPFGGITVITVGDLFQLKPVFDRWIFENAKTCYGVLASNLWTDFFTLFELTDIMRQKDDRQFAELLNRLREGKHTELDIDCLKERLLHTARGDENYPMETTHLFTTNASVNAHNNSMYTKSQNDKCQIEAIDIVVGDISDDLKKQIKDKIPNDPTKTMGLYSLASIATNAKYDLTTNVDVTDGLTNGAECVIKNIDYRVENSSRPSIIWVLFQDAAIGKKQRKENAHLYKTKGIIDRAWTPILEVTRQFRINRKSQVQILRRQFPLRPASAKTIHRCQGDTLSAAVVDFPSSTQEHVHYVGLSRVRNSSTLHIINLNEHKIRVSEKVVNEMNRLRTEAYLVPLVTLKTVDDSFTIVFHNVRSLHLHMDDVRSDYNIQKADVNIFVETRLCTLDKDNMYSMKGFTLYRNDYTQSPTRSCYGSAVYIKNLFHFREMPHRCNMNGVEITIMVTDQLIPNLHVVGIYRSGSNVTLAKFIDALNYLHDSKLTTPDIPVVLLGDFNVNLLEQSSEQTALTRSLIAKRGYTQLIKQYTTDYRSLIDHIYTNVPHLVESSGVLESYYSDHKPVFISLTTR